MSKLTVLMAVEIDNQDDWLGLDDYKTDIGENATDLEVFNLLAAEENGSALSALVNLVDANNPSHFVAVIDDEFLSSKPTHYKRMSALAIRARQLEQQAEDLAKRVRHRECEHGVILYGNCRECEDNPEFS